MKKRVLQYSVTAIVGIVFAVVCAALRGIFTFCGTTGELMALISDALLIPGAVITSIGVLGIVASFGFFDILSYGAKYAMRAFLPATRFERLTYYEYKCDKAEKRRPAPMFIVWTGVGFIAASVLFLIIYFIVG